MLKVRIHKAYKRKWGDIVLYWVSKKLLDVHIELLFRCLWSREESIDKCLSIKRLQVVQSFSNADKFNGDWEFIHNTDLCPHTEHTNQMNIGNSLPFCKEWDDLIFKLLTSTLPTWIGSMTLGFDQIHSHRRLDMIWHAWSFVYCGTKCCQ